MSCTGSVDPTAIWKIPKATVQPAPERGTFVKSSIWSSRARTCWYKFIIWVYDLGRATGSDMLSKANYALERKQMIGLIGLHLRSVRSVCFWTGSGEKLLSIMLDMQWIPTWNGIFSPSRWLVDSLIAQRDCIASWINVILKQRPPLPRAKF